MAKNTEHTLNDIVGAGMTRYRSVKTLKKFILSGELVGHDTAPPGSKYTRIVCTEQAIEDFNSKLKTRRVSAADSLRDKKRPSAPAKKKRK